LREIDSPLSAPGYSFVAMQMPVNKQIATAKVISGIVRLFIVIVIVSPV